MMRPKREYLNPTNLTRRGVPKHLHSCTLDDLNDFGNPNRKPVIEYVKNYINNLDEKFNNNEGIFLFGSNGVGKSFIASLITKYAYAYRYTSKRCTFVDYINEYTRVWGCKNAQEKEEREELLYHNYKAVEFLCLEEIGKEVDSKVSSIILEDLLRYREEHGLVTIICTNLNSNILLEKYGASIMSIIKGNCTPIKIVGEDMRKEVFQDRKGV